MFDLTHKTHYAHLIITLFATLHTHTHKSNPTIMKINTTQHFNTNPNSLMFLPDKKKLSPP